MYQILVITSCVGVNACLICMFVLATREVVPTIKSKINKALVITMAISLLVVLICFFNGMFYNLFELSLNL